MKVIKLLKTWAYSLCAACCATAFSSIGNNCRLGGYPCGTFEFAVIGLTVASFVVCFLMLAMWLLNDEGAAGISPLASNLLLVLLVVAVGMTSRVPDMVSLGTIFVALVVALLLAVYSWNQLTNPPEPYAPAAKTTEDVEAVAPSA